MFTILKGTIDLSKKRAFYDTDCLSSFLLTDNWSILESLFDEIVIPYAVYEELTAKGSPYKIVDNLEFLIGKKFIKINDIDINSVEHRWYDDIRIEYQMNRRFPIGEGELQALALAIPNGGILASNNLSDIAYFVKKYRLPLLTSAYILALSCDKGHLTYEEAKFAWKQMNNKGLRMPGSFDNYYEGQYRKDLKQYGKRLGL